MTPSPSQNLLAANAGAKRVTIGLDAAEELRQLSDARALTCPGCGAAVVLHAGTVRAHHFAHLPGTVCRLPQSEPETEEHRAGKLLLARWLRVSLPDAEVIVEAHLPATQQRADVLAIIGGPDGNTRRIAIEFQCANLTAREWRRRHQLYRSAEIEDLWLVGGSRLIHEAAVPTPGPDGVQAMPANGVNLIAIRTSELERTLLWDGAPLLFLDAIGERLSAERLARFRPAMPTQAMRPTGRLAVKPLLELPFPWRLLAWPDNGHPDVSQPAAARRVAPGRSSASAGSELFLWEWLAQRHRVTPATLAPFFGLALPGAEAFACTSQAWQAAIYYRFIHCRVGDHWWQPQVETWACAYLPIARPVSMSALKTAITSYQEALGAAGMLSLPVGYGRMNARITDDLTTLRQPPDPAETLRLVRYRRTLTREAPAEYNVAGSVSFSGASAL
jgi:hypothetical protein